MSAQEPRVPADDWRRRNQERYLEGKSLAFRKYDPPRPEWDHDHCEFCNAKFSLFPGDLTHGYATTDEDRWICETCFADFKDEFGWTLKREA
jgi:hypothetical protein